MSPRLRTAVTVTIALLLVLGLVVPAFAHAQLVSSNPQDGASLPTVDEVVLTFNEPISPDFVQLLAQGPDGDVADGDPLIDGNTVTQPIRPSSSGQHSLTFRVVSADGHPVSGSITFTLTDAGEPPADTDATAVAAPTTTADATDQPQPTVEALVAPTEPAAATSTAEQSSTGFAVSLWAIVLLAVGVGAAVLYALFGRRHPEH